MATAADAFSRVLEAFDSLGIAYLVGKLEWYRAGGEVSERQWNDLRGIVRVRGQNLDFEYLRQWSGRLGVSDLLERLLAEKV